MNTVTGTDTPAATANAAAVNSPSTGGGGGNVAQNPAFWNFLSSVVGTAGGIATALIGNNQQQQGSGSGVSSGGFSFGGFSGGGYAPTEGTTNSINIANMLPYILAAAAIIIVILILRKKSK